MKNSNLVVKPLTARSVGDFWSLHSDEVEHGWCCCTAWWSPSFKVFSKRTATENRQIREELFAKEQFDGFILYENDDPLGWCQCGSLKRLPLLCEVYDLDEATIDEKVQAISCLFLKPSARNKGLAHKLLAGLLEHLKDEGFEVVKAFPRCGDNLPAGEVWTGPGPLFTRAGFTKIGGSETMPIFELSL